MISGAPHKFNQYGVFVNGPVLLPKVYNGRDKTFFTFGWEASRNVLYAPVTATVPTALQRQGIFTEAPGLIYDPYSTAGNTRQPLPAGCNSAGCFPAGKVVQNINPVSQKLLAVFPVAECWRPHQQLRVCQPYQRSGGPVQLPCRPQLLVETARLRSRHPRCQHPS